MSGKPGSTPSTYGRRDSLRAAGALGDGPMFKAAFPDEQNPVTSVNWGKAIGAYERTLGTPAPFDTYLAGSSQALSSAAKAGLTSFIGFGCAGCHNGVGVGGGTYQRFGSVKEYWSATGSKQIDKGRFEATKDPADLMCSRCQACATWR